MAKKYMTYWQFWRKSGWAARHLFALPALILGLVSLYGGEPKYTYTISILCQLLVQVFIHGAVLLLARLEWKIEYGDHSKAV